MKLHSRTPVSSLWLLAIIGMVFTTQAVQAQCPVGSTVNTAGNFGAGQTICITTGFNGAITLNSGATMVVTTGGNYTGNLTANAGSSIQVQAGGGFAPNQANNFASSLVNNGAVSFNNISLSTGASFSNNGSFNWGSNWNQGSVTLALTNTACGAMTFSQGTGLTNNSSFINNGVLNFTQGLNISSGSTVNNRGRITVGGDLSLGGTFYNQNIAVFKGSNNNISSNTVSDSLVNLGKMTVTGSITTSIRTRNEGLFVVNGSYTINGNTFRINNNNAQVRVGGSFSNNGQLQGNGSLHVAGVVGNNQTIAGYGAGTQQLTVNKSSVPGTQSNLLFNTALVAMDTATYVPTMSNPASCVVLPMRLSTLQAVYHNSQVQLNWLAYSTTDIRSFTIEYSQDGQSFTKAGELAVAGSNDQTTTYSYSHVPAVTGSVFYRVRETDRNGNEFYSNMVVVKTGNTLLTTTYVFPNPFIDNLQISMQLEKAGVIQAALYDASGRLVKRQQQTGLLGRNTIVMSNLTALLPGVYLVYVKAGNHTSFEKLIK